MITIVDYGLGNPASIVNMLAHIGIESRISADPDDIASASHLILPGVGAFDRGMQELQSRDLIQHLNRAVIDNKTPALGICLGAQLLLDSSEEGSEKGLGWISGQVVKFDLTDYPDLKIPHMGWNKIYPKRPTHLLDGLDD